MAIHLERVIPGAPEKVYALLTNGAKLGEITGRPGKGGGSEGAFFSLFGDWVQGRQVELVPAERVVQAWRFQDWEPGRYSLVRFTLMPEGTGTRLVVDHEAYPPELHAHLSSNWKPFYFDPLAKYFGD